MSSLLPDERLLWEGHPPTGFLWRQQELLLLPFSLLWGGFAIFWNVGVWTSGAPLEFRLFGIPFLLIGVYVTVGRFLVDGWLRARTTYQVTSRRVIVRRGERSVRSLDIRRLPMLDLTEHGDGSGTIRFEGGATGPRMNWIGPWVALAVIFAAAAPAVGGSLKFLRVPDARSVYDLISRQAG